MPLSGGLPLSPSHPIRSRLPSLFPLEVGPLHPSGENYKLPQQGPEQTPPKTHFLHFPVQKHICWQ